MQLTSIYLQIDFVFIIKLNQTQANVYFTANVYTSETKLFRCKQTLTDIRNQYEYFYESKELRLMSAIIAYDLSLSKVRFRIQIQVRF